MTEVGELVDGVSFNDIGGAPADAGPYDFFVSYVPGDRAWADWIAWQLKERLRLDGRQPKLFVRDWDVVPGMHETASRQDALTRSNRVVALLTPEYLTSPSGIEEWSAVASDDSGGFQRRVVPVRVKACQPSGLWSSIRLIDLVDHNVTSAIDTLLLGMNSSLEGQAVPAKAPPFPGLGRPIEDTVAGPPFPGQPVVVGEPPTVPPNWFQDRSADIENIERHLGDGRTGLVMVTGQEGVGKTAMIHRLWERIRTDESPLRVHGLVYLSAHGFKPVTADRVIEGLIGLFPEHEADQLEVMVRPPLPWVEKLDILLGRLGGRNAIVAIDAVEELLDDDGDITDPALRDLVNHLVSQAERGIRLLLVGRDAADAVAGRFRGMTYPRDLDSGLSGEESMALLRAMDADGVLRLDAVPDHDKGRLRRLTGGSPRTLELAYGVLAPGERSFTWLLEFLGGWAAGESVVVRLLDQACERLSLRERRVLQALAVYGRPVPAIAVHHLLHDAVPDLDSWAVLKQLHQLRLAHSDGVYFSVPATEERDYLIDLVRRDSGVGGGETPEVLLRRAADYFAGQRNPEPRQLAQLWPQLVEIELRLRAGDHDAAFQLMESVDDGYLLGWGSSSALVPALRMLLGSRGISSTLEIDAKSMFARAQMEQGDYGEAMDHLKRALTFASGHRQANRRIVLREQLTEAYLQLGYPRQAAAHSRQACLAAIWQRRERFAMTALAGWAMCLARQGRFSAALRLFAMARKMLKLFGIPEDRIYLPIMLYDEAWIYGQLGDRPRARSLLREGERQASKLGDRMLYGQCLLGEAQLALDDRNPAHAIALAEQASNIGVQKGNRRLCRDAMEILAWAQLDWGDFPAAARAANIARRNRGSVLGFGLVGLVAYRRGDKEDARAAFREGYLQASGRYRPNECDFQFLDAYGLVACGLALLGEPSCMTTALTAYREAREITSASGAVHRALMLLAQFGPRADSRILEQVRLAARGNEVAEP